ncbi:MULTISPECIES: signal peptidase I [unclassified Paenibacillus]|uniref:signal peptidase I n=1 Tax=unclassified Paenibacillus TaxID=185978 RepID=UPI001FB74942|nr:MULTISPECIES: signal peptidase I [unclassified Paenibacillus]NIK68917.1 signal peptidase I [Paenibacillus sp. BK720]
MDDRLTGKSNVPRELREWLFSIAAAIMIALLFQNYVYAQAKVHNISMQKTLAEGQRLIEDKWSYRFTPPERGDIVIIHGPESPLRLVKRVIGVPGDIIDVRDGLVVLNGQPLSESYSVGSTMPGRMLLPYTIAPKELFVLGDNREHSVDSRTIGPIAFSSIEGKAVCRIWPLNKFGLL